MCGGRYLFGIRRGPFQTRRSSTGSGEAWYPRVTFRMSFLGVDDCANLSREVSTILDVEDVVPGSYLLEVSSPGLDRKLSRPADFERFTGSRVKIMTREPVNGNRHFDGRLQSFQQGRLTLDLAIPKKKSQPAGTPQLLELTLDNVEKANLVPEL